MYLYPMIAMLILLPALVLWAVPKTRRSAGATVTAWKTVPFGCMTMLVVPNLMAAVWIASLKLFRLPGSMAFHAVMMLVCTVIGAALGFRVIVLMKNHIRKRYGAPDGGEPESKKPYYFAFGCLTLVPLVLIFGAFVWFLTPGSNTNYGPWRTYPVVTEQGTELAFQERSIHPFLAEYEYRFRFRKDGAETFQNLWVNTGGRTFFNVFRLKDGRLFFSDKLNDYIVDVKTRKVWLVLEDGREYYAGSLPSEGFDSPGYGFGKEGGKFQIRIGQRPVETMLVSDQLGWMTYIGCITNGFYPAAKKTYVPVQKLR
ncbi:MAG: hypothetical protein IJS14_02725 [Lentisphaeria bacterium]|nr:hypothetical protein [Lentisphaeria bacterium]